jgi:hypothetical protein
MGKADLGMCECGIEEERVRHFLFQSPQWLGPRRALYEALGERRSDLSYALGGWSGRIERRTGREIGGSKEKMETDITAIRAVIQFVKATQRPQPRKITGSEEDEYGREGGEEEEDGVGGEEGSNAWNLNA